MTLPLELGDRVGEALAFDQEWLWCVFPVPFAPGAPVDFVVSLNGLRTSLHGKATGSKRCTGEGEPRFEVKLRMISLRREQREALASQLPAGTATRHR